MSPRAIVVTLLLVGVTVGLAFAALSLRLPLGVQMGLFFGALLDAWFGGTRRLLAALTRPLGPNDDPPGPFTLYLRSFKDDVQTVGAGDDIYQTTLESRAARQLWRIAPMVKLANIFHPWKNIHLSTTIAVPNARDDDSQNGGLKPWQEVVLRLAPKASAIVLLLSSTKSVLWELEQLVRLGLTDRLVVVLPPVDLDDATQRWKDLRAELKKAAESHEYIAKIRALDPSKVAAIHVTKGGKKVEIDRVREEAYGSAAKPRAKAGIDEWDAELRDAITKLTRANGLTDRLPPVPNAGLLTLLLIAPAVWFGSRLDTPVEETLGSLPYDPVFALQGAAFVILAYAAFALEKHWQLRAAVQSPGHAGPIVEYLFHATLLLLGLLA